MCCDTSSIIRPNVIRPVGRPSGRHVYPVGLKADLHKDVHTNIRSCSSQRGFSLPVAIFILVVMALIGSALVNLTQSSHQALSQEVMSTRAFYAAESGAQYAMGQLFPLNGAAATCSAPYPTVTLTAMGLDGCTAVITCSSNTLGANTYYTLTSTGSCSFATTSATRQIELMAKSP